MIYFLEILKTASHNTEGSTLGFHQGSIANAQQAKIIVI